jgi:hypothetical protein
VHDARLRAEAQRLHAGALERAPDVGEKDSPALARAHRLPLDGGHGQDLADLGREERTEPVAIQEAERFLRRRHGAERGPGRDEVPAVVPEIREDERDDVRRARGARQAPGLHARERAPDEVHLRDRRARRHQEPDRLGLVLEREARRGGRHEARAASRQEHEQETVVLQRAGDRERGAARLFASWVGVRMAAGDALVLVRELLEGRAARAHDERAVHAVAERLVSRERHRHRRLPDREERQARGREHELAPIGRGERANEDRVPPPTEGLLDEERRIDGPERGVVQPRKELARVHGPGV